GMWTFARRPDQESNANAFCGHRGFFEREKWHSMADITDGTSNSIAMSEGICPTRRGSTLVKGGVAVYQPHNLAGGTAHNAIAGMCMANGYSATDRTKVATPAVNLWRGWLWTNGRAADAWINTCMPPNSVCCVASDSMHSWGAFPPSSYHSGGVNVLRADGSVTFVSDTVDCGNLNDVQVVQGPSNYGVWGAMGSIDGGESRAF
ncbi:MAG: DUF1559 domain-containing protein, partial [Planctomycetaceae bacterium]|nr:DUF1559 domain-containing protein [Planctomycetaceae bacterium]